MPRGNIQSNIDRGILTTYNVAELTGFSVSLVRKLCEKSENGIPYTHLPGSKEIRISAGPLLDYLLSNQFPVSDRLREAAVNYKRIYGNSAQHDSIHAADNQINAKAEPATSATPAAPTSS